jgi:hypothetical protein
LASSIKKTDLQLAIYRKILLFLNKKKIQFNCPPFPLIFTKTQMDNSKEAVWSPLLVALVASMTQAFGISIQRKSHLLSSNDTTIPLYKRPLWISGFLIYTISNLIGSTCTIGYLPIVILAPVGAIGLVFNAIFAKWILGDPFTKRTVFGKVEHIQIK